MLRYLLDLVARLGHWSYLILFTAAALECAAFAGLLVPGETAERWIGRSSAVLAAVAAVVALVLWVRRRRTGARPAQEGQ